MAEIAVLNRSRADDADVAFAAAACDEQLRRDFLPAWFNAPYTPVRFYTTERDLPVANDLARLLVVSDTIDVQGANAYHTMDPLKRAVVLNAGRLSISMSHEILEMGADPTANAWVAMPDGRLVALENCDPVENDTYEIEVEISKKTRAETVSNFVFPTWFEAQGSAPFDFMRKLSTPFTLAPGGYMIVREKGKTYDVWAQSAMSVGARTTKILNSTSRTYRRGVRLW